MQRSALRKVYLTDVGGGSSARWESKLGGGVGEGKLPGQQYRMNIVFCSFLDADVYYCISVFCCFYCMECGLIIWVMTNLRTG